MSNMTKLNLFLLLVLVVALGFQLAIQLDPTKPNYLFLPDMARSLPYDTFAPNPVFADGKTLQPPVPGTIPWGYLPLPYANTSQEAIRAGEELRNPLSLENPQILQRGAALFAIFCRPCHGHAGQGDGPVAQRGFPPPPSLLGERARQMKDGQLFHIITFGQGNMPAHGAQIPREDRWRIAAYVRSLQASQVDSAGSKP